MNARYHGKPLLRLIELYVIDSVGHLKPQDAVTLEAITPKLQELYNTKGDWRSAICKAMSFPESMNQNIKTLWAKNQKIAQEKGVSLSAEDFAVMFVDSNIET